MRNRLPSLVATAAMLFGGATIADDIEPPMYVSATGIDTGNCLDPKSPCRSIDFALRRVGKNGQIRVGEGSFRLANPEDLIYLLSGAIDVRGGYPDGAQSTLVGVPHEFANVLSNKGFDVIADTKGSDGARSIVNEKLVQMQRRVNSNVVATPCVGGFAGVFPCVDVDLLAHVSDRTPAATGADIWGFMDLNTNREYAIVGYSTGTAVFDVTDAENPREVGFIDGQSTTWRDIKIYQLWNANDARYNAYAYVVADNATDGLFIIDLSQLPQSISRINYSSDFARAHNVYLSDAEFATGLSVSGAPPTLILAGSNLSDGRFRGYSLANPASPSIIAAPATPAGQAGNDRLYMHDAASMIVRDARKDTQCVNAAASDHCDVLFDFNESTVDIWDITDASNPVRLSQTPYNNAGYVHSGWWSEDQQFLFVQDELDERDLGLPFTTLRIFSISDLTAPTLSTTWSGPTSAIDHNGFVRGNRYYMSNYARGLSILDITNAASPTLVGHFDTFPSSDSVGFPGNWGAYPYLPSGNIALSDIDSGFYLVADNTLDVAEGTLSFTTTAYGGDETQGIELVVQRAGGSQGAITVQWEAIAATASFDDVASIGSTPSPSGTLIWADGDTTDRTVILLLINDGNAEGLERLLVKLVSPTGGATLSSPSIASAYLSDPGSTPVVEFATSSISVAERGFATAIAVVHRSGSAAGAMSVDFAIGSGDALANTDFTGPTSGTLNWADGDADPKSIEFAITDDGVAEADEFLELNLSNATGGGIGAGSLLRITILDGLGSNSAPNAIAGSSQTVSGGAIVNLDGSASNDPDGDTLSYVWSQTLGPAVTLSSTTAATTSFTAPGVTSDTLLRFMLQVSDPGGQADTSLVSVTVQAQTPAVTGGGGGGGFGLIFLRGLFGLVVTRAISPRTLSQRDAT